MALSRMCIVVLDDPSWKALERAIAQAGGSPRQVDLVDDDNYYILVSRERKIGWHLGWLRMRMMMDGYSREHADRLLEGTLGKIGRPIGFEDIYNPSRLVWASSHPLLFPLSPPGSDYDFDFVNGMLKLLGEDRVVVFGGSAFIWGEIVGKAPWLGDIDADSCVDIVDTIASGLDWQGSRSTVMSRYDSSRDLYVLMDCGTGRKTRIRLGLNPLPRERLLPAVPETLDVDLVFCGRNECSLCGGKQNIPMDAPVQFVELLANMGVFEMNLSGCEPAFWEHPGLLCALHCDPTVLSLSTGAPEALLMQRGWINHVQALRVRIDARDARQDYPARESRIGRIIGQFASTLSLIWPVRNKRLEFELPLSEHLFFAAPMVASSINSSLSTVVLGATVLLRSAGEVSNWKPSRLEEAIRIISSCNAPVLLDSELSHLLRGLSGGGDRVKANLWPVNEEGYERCYMRISSEDRGVIDVVIRPNGWDSSLPVQRLSGRRITKDDLLEAFERLRTEAERHELPDRQEDHRGAARLHGARGNGQ